MEEMQAEQAAPEPHATPTLDMEALLQAIEQDDEQHMLMYVRSIRKLLCASAEPPARQLLEHEGSVTRLIAMLESDNQKLAFEAAWALTNIASTQYTRAIVDAGVLPVLVRNLRATDVNLREQCIWCIGNIAGDCVELRDLVIAHGAVHDMLPYAYEQNAETESLQRNTVWALSNICRGRQCPPAYIMAQLQTVFYEVGSVLLQRARTGVVNTTLLSDVLWGISYLTDSTSDVLQAAIDAGIVAACVPMLDASNHIDVILPALRVCGNAVAGNDQQTQAALDANLLTFLQPLTHSGNRRLRKEACWIVSNVAAGTPQQVNLLLREIDLLQHCVDLLRHDELDVRRECVYVFANMIEEGSFETVHTLVAQLNVVPSLVSMLNVPHNSSIVLILSALHKILATASKNGEDWRMAVVQANGVEPIHSLQMHASHAIFQKANAIIEDFFRDEEEDDGADTLDHTPPVFDFA